MMTSRYLNLPWLVVMLTACGAAQVKLAPETWNLANGLRVVPVATLKLFGPRYWCIVLGDLAAAAFLSLLATNLRWNAWMTHYRISRFYEPINDQPRWAMNLLLGVLFAAVIAACAFKDRRDRKVMETTDEKETEQ